MKTLDTRERELPNEGRAQRYIYFVMPLREIRRGITIT
jgi:hypothetical protein